MSPKTTDAARTLAALRKRKGPKPGFGVKRFRCIACHAKLTTKEAREHRCWAKERK